MPYRVEHSQDTDATYIYIREGMPVARTLDAGKGIILDLDENDEVVGVEVLREQK